MEGIRSCQSSSGQWIRCDHNCDGVIDVADALAGFSELFHGGPRSCCPQATDCNSDGVGNTVSDWVGLFGIMFMNTQRPTDFGECETGGCEDYTYCS